jgi:metal transporter CNNM
VFTRHGLYLGAKLAFPTTLLIYGLVSSIYDAHIYIYSPICSCAASQGIVSWPIAKILELALGPHHGIIYRRAGMSCIHLFTSPHSIPSLELKELIALHSHGALHGGDLKNDTVTIIGATLDLQEKVVKQVSPKTIINSSR